MWVWILIVANVPVYLLIGWLFFDEGGSRESAEGAAVTLFEGIWYVARQILLPRAISGAFFGEDDDGQWAVVKLAAYFVACAAAVYGEYRLIQHFF